MDCCRFRWLAPSYSSAKGDGRPAAPLPFSSSPYLDQRQSTPHHRHHHYSNSPERAHLIPKYQRRPHSMPGPGSVDQKTIIENSKRYQVTISNRELKWDHLQEYLELEFEGLKVPDQQRKTLNEKYVLNLPAKLSPKQLQDIDFLRGDDEDARTFLDDLKNERLLAVNE